MDSTVPSIIAGAALLSPAAQDFLKRIGGPVADDLGVWIRDTLRDFRARNTVRVTDRAHRMLKSAKLEPSAIPLRTLLPLLEGASREDDPGLVELWAALLANAASGTALGILPIFPFVLSQLSPSDAIVLATIRQLEEAGLPPYPSLPSGQPALERWGVQRPEMIGALKLVDDSQLEVSLNVLLSLGLLQDEPPIRNDDLKGIFFSSREEFRISPLGRRFLQACTAPTSRPANADRQAD